jgi:exonuclease III
MIHWNCNSINNKIDKFKDFCLNNKPHIISLNETKLNEDRASYFLKIDNYILIHKSRNSGKNGAGGVELLIREDVKFS